MRLTKLWDRTPSQWPPLFLLTYSPPSYTLCKSHVCTCSRFQPGKAWSLAKAAVVLLSQIPRNPGIPWWNALQILEDPIIEGMESRKCTKYFWELIWLYQSGGLAQLVPERWNQKVQPATMFFTTSRFSKSKLTFTRLIFSLAKVLSLSFPLLLPLLYYSNLPL